MSFLVKEDAFATGTDRRLVNHTPYYFTVVAYAYNEYEPFDQVLHPNGQRKPFLAGRNNVKKYEGIPHLVDSEAGGTVQNSVYGYSPIITRELREWATAETPWSWIRLPSAPSSTTFVLSHPTYKSGYGPVNVKVVDPSERSAGQFQIAL